MDEPDAAHDRDLRSKIDRLSPDIDVAVVKGLQHLRQGDAVLDQAIEIDGDIIGFGLPAPSGDVDHAGQGLEPALEYPVLYGLEVGEAVAGRADDPIAKDFADRALRRDLRR